jgi:signal transduction histidine kinase
MVIAGRAQIALEDPELGGSTRRALGQIMRATPGPVDLTAEIEESMELLRALVGSLIRIELIVGRDLPHVRGEAGQFRSVLMNLAVNARDAMPAGGVFRLEAGDLLMRLERLATQFPWSNEDARAAWAVSQS